MRRLLSHHLFLPLTLCVVGWLLVYNMGGRAIMVQAFGESDWKIWRVAPNIPQGEHEGLYGIGIENFLLYLLGKFTFWAGAVWMTAAVAKRIFSPAVERIKTLSPVSGD